MVIIIYFFKVEKKYIILFFLNYKTFQIFKNNINRFLINKLIYNNYKINIFHNIHNCLLLKFIKDFYTLKKDKNFNIIIKY